jgi:uncharacterized protein
MRRLFAVTRTKGGSWNPAKILEEQEEWASHAAFMNGLHAEGFVLLVGPLEGTPDVLLIIRAEDEQEIRSRLEADPWTRNGLLQIKEVVPWRLRLGTI